jgi:Family of unknown function (DUF6088)
MPRGPALDLATRIDERVGTDAGQVWTPVDFLDLGPRAAIDKALQRLSGDGKLFRVARGLYYRRRTNNLTRKPAEPDVRAILEAIARRDHSRMVVDGLAAANDLGLTTAVPARVRVLTDARLRPIQLGKQRIVFQTVAPRRLYWAGRPAMRVVQALYWLRDILNSGDAQTVRRLHRVLADPAHGAAIRSDLREGLSTLPIWMQTIVRQLLERHSHDPVARKGRRRSRQQGV